MKGEWASDGRGIFYVITDSRTDISRVVHRDLEDGSDKDLYKAAPGERIWMSASPRRQEIAVMELAAYIKTRTLKIIPVNEQKSSVLCTFRDDNRNFPAMGWTPDSKYIYFSRVTGEDEEPSVWRIKVSGGELQRLGSPTPGLICLSFHPDGKRVALCGLTRGKSDELWVMENFLPDEENESKGGQR
jgi:Tol biopolymer transport system component